MIRIIREEDRLYLVALDEGAKTLVNGRAVIGASDPLLSGDIVQFGDQLTFTVTQANDIVSDTPTMAVQQNKLKLLLLPKSEQGPAAPVAINKGRATGRAGPRRRACSCRPGSCRPAR